MKSYSSEAPAAFWTPEPVPETDADRRRIMLRAAVILKRQIRAHLHEMNRLSDERHAKQREKRLLEAPPTPFNHRKLEGLETAIEELNNQQEKIRSILVDLGALTIELSPGFDACLTLHDMAQVFSISHIALQKLVARYSDEGNEREERFTRLAFSYHAESVHNKEDFIPPYLSSAPFFAAIFERFMDEVERNTEFRKACREKVDEFFPGLPMYRQCSDGSLKPVLRAVKAKPRRQAQSQ